MTAPPDTQPGRPTVDDVALVIRARTKDSAMHEVGTFDDDTRPTATEVEAHIDASYWLIATRLPAPAKLPASLLSAFTQVVALEAACRIEKAYWPEQVRSDRSNYSVLKTERDEELAALADAAELAVGTEFGGFAFGMIPVGSWTSMPNSWIRPQNPPAEEEPAP